MNILLLLIAVVAVGFSGPFNEIAVKHCAWSGFQVASFRLLGAAGLLFLCGALRELKQAVPWGRDLFQGSLWLGLHFGLWTGAFAFASLSSAVMCLAAQPLFSLLLTRRDVAERPGRAQWVGLLLGSVGLILIGWQDFHLEPRQILGNLMVIFAGLAIVRYQMTTRAANAALPPFMFNTLVWGLAGMVLLPGALLSGDIPESGGWPYLWGLILLPTLIGHGCFNRVLPRLKLIVVNLAILAEPVLSLLIGRAMNLDTWPVGWRLTGMLSVLAGVTIALFFRPESAISAESSAFCSRE